MTVSECLKDWLNEYENLQFEDIDTDFIESATGSYSISKSPNTVVIPFNDGSKQITEYYQFFARQPVIENAERIENQQIMADIEEWVEERDFEEDYPDLQGIGTCVEVAITASYSLTSLEEDNNAIYQITISITYMKER